MHHANGAGGVGAGERPGAVGKNERRFWVLGTGRLADQLNSVGPTGSFNSMLFGMHRECVGYDSFLFG